ncbi:alpha/beta fold hydrolase [Simiduia aestuariiviva]|uniref:Pimeloyl-ACP methyl ester carboxylesterase n=1 Tax=Simiduia aestuariiviva TaxID=1510459 RepID=A0A839UN12_9GAMM|nr:alpha/beta hydrolase [Simiduia aestuariiviva]MBB3169232.1 pimeloyl-ACP methyl ester carboxylesterase [Simiduia aestuariiviva]
MKQTAIGRWVASALLLLFVAEPLSAQSWWDEVSSQVGAAAQQVSKQLDAWHSDAPQQPVARGKGLPVDGINGVQYTVFVEPIFNAEILIVQAGMANTQTVVLIHGLGQSGHLDWRHQIALLAQNYHVLALDLPGFGYSGVPEGRYSPTNYAAVVKAAVDKFSKNTPIIVGHSMGGAVSLRYAAQYPSQLRRLVLVDAAGILERTAFVKHMGYAGVGDEAWPTELRAAMAKLKDFGGSLVEWGTFNDPTTELQRSNMAWRMLMTNAPNTNAGLSLVNENFANAVFEVQVPTNLIWGARDNVAPLRTGKLLAAQMPRVNLHILPDAGHVPMVSHSAQFNDILMQVLLTEPPAATHKSSLMPGTRDLHCKGEASRRYSGQYRHIVIENCTNIELHNVSAESLTIKHSLVVAEDMHIASTGTALSLTESVLTMTNAEINAVIGISLEASRLDAAGLQLRARNIAVRAGTKSRLVASVSQVTSPAYSGVLHGSFDLSAQLLFSTDK